LKLSPAKAWCVAFVGFFLVIAGWSLAAPYDGSPDEVDHVVRAVGVVSGEIAPPAADAKRGTGAFQTVPQGLVRTNCWAFDASRSAACAVPPDSDSTPVVAPTGAGRYFPLYYAAVGLPLKWWPGWTGLFLARMIGGVGAAALLAGSLVTIMTRSRHRLMLAGLIVAYTPMAAHIAGAVNPNGLEIAAAIAFFVSAIHLLVGRVEKPSAALLWLFGSSAVALAVLRASGLLCLAVGFTALLVPWSSTHVRELVRRKLVWIWIAAISLAGIAAFAWIMAMDTTDLGDYTRGRILTPSQAWLVEAENWRAYLDQVVGVTAWLDTRMSGVFYLLWQMIAAALVIAALICGRLVDRWRSLVLFGGGVLVPAYLEVRFANETGFITQGRYLLPVLAGFVLFSAFVIEERGLPAVHARAAVRSAAVVLLPIHLVCLLYTMARWQRGLPGIGVQGITSLDPSRGDWHPVVGWMTPVIVEIVGLLIIAVLAWRSVAQDDHAEPVVLAAAPVSSARAADVGAVTRPVEPSSPGHSSPARR
jgi:hypothetical protein